MAARLAVERTRLHTLRGVIRFAVQALGAMLVFFVLFGVPNQMSTILGLAGAGLTVALKEATPPSRYVRYASTHRPSLVLERPGRSAESEATPCIVGLAEGSECLQVCR